MRPPLKAILRLLLSRRAAVTAMALLAGLLALGSFAPEAGPDELAALRARRPVRAWVLERLNPGALSRSPLFLGLPAFIAAGVATSMWQRLRARRGQQGPPSLERFTARRALRLPAAPAKAAEQLRAALWRIGFSPAREHAGELFGSRGSAGFWGSMVFHGGLLVTLLGISLSALGRFDGELVLAEGIPAEMAAASMLRAAPAEALGDLAGIRLEASQVWAELTAASQLVACSAVLELRRPGAAARREVISVNQPVWLDRFQLSLHRYGFAPEVEATDPQGRPRAAGLATVRVLPPGTEDAIPLDGGGELRLRLYPDFALAQGQPASRSDLPLRPVLAFRWIEGGRAVAEGRVARGEEALVGGYRVAFPALRYWVDLLVGRDPGLAWFAAGALLCVAGLAVRFSWHEQSWRARLAQEGPGTRIELALSSRYFPASLEERAEKVVRMLHENELERES